MKRVTYINYQDKQILFLDLSRITSENIHDFMNAIEECKSVIKLNPPTSTLVLTSVIDSYSNFEMVQKLKELTNFNKPYIKASAVIGVTGIKKAIYQTVNRFSGRNIKIFDSEKEAKNYLISQ